MDSLKIEGTKYTPEIIADGVGRVFSIKGKSYPENTFEFYQPVFQWVSSLLEGAGEDEITFNFAILYFNSSSSKAFYDLFDMLEAAVKNGAQIVINWFFDAENETIEEAGSDFAEDFESLTFNMCEAGEG